MDSAPPPIGVTAATPAPPAWPEGAQWVPAPADLPPVASPPDAPAWPRSAQGATAVMLVLALGLLAWHAWGLQRWGARPTTLEPGAVIDRVDLNRADSVQLLQLPGVGEGLAQRIEAYRLQHNGFRSVDELRGVGGIGPALLERLRPLVCVEPYESGEQVEPASKLPRPTAPPSRRMGSLSRTSKKNALRGLVNVNRATAAQLQQLPGIGPKRAQSIIQVREERPFRSVDELRRVRGIGAKTLERLRPHVTVERDSGLTAGEE